MIYGEVKNANGVGRHLPRAVFLGKSKWAGLCTRRGRRGRVGLSLRDKLKVGAWAAKQAAKRGTQTLLKLGIDKTVETTKFVVSSTPAATKFIGDTLVHQHKHLGANAQKMVPGVLAASAVAASVDLTDIALAGTCSLPLPAPPPFPNPQYPGRCQLCCKIV